MVRAVPELQGAAVVTDAGTHHVVASACLEAGLHVLCEKPLALTMRGCNRIVETARRTGRNLSIAQNYRREPLHRPARPLIPGGAIGQAIFHFAGHGRPAQDRQVYGSKGSLVCPGDRNGRPITLCFEGGTEVSGEEILGYAPSYRLSPVAAELFGGERIWTYDFP